MADGAKSTKSAPFRFVSRHRNFFSAFFHMGLFAIAFFSAFGLYYNFKNFNLWVRPFYLPLLLIVIPIKMCVFAWLKMFRGSWRYIGMRDLLAVVKATHISTAI